MGPRAGICCGIRKLSISQCAFVRHVPLGHFGWTCTFVKPFDCVIAARGDASARVTAVSQPVATGLCPGKPSSNPGPRAMGYLGTCCNFCNFVRASQQLLRSTARWIARRGAQQSLGPGQDPWQPCAHLHWPAFGLCGVCEQVQAPPPCPLGACDTAARRARGRVARTNASTCLGPLAHMTSLAQHMYMVQNRCARPSRALPRPSMVCNAVSEYARGRVRAGATAGSPSQTTHMTAHKGCALQPRTLPPLVMSIRGALRRRELAATGRARDCACKMHTTMSCPHQWSEQPSHNKNPRTLAATTLADAGNAIAVHRGDQAVCESMLAS